MARQVSLRDLSRPLFIKVIIAAMLLSACVAHPTEHDTAAAKVISVNRESIRVPLGGPDWEVVHALKDKSRSLFGWRLRPAQNKRWTKQLMVSSFSKRSRSLPTLKETMGAVIGHLRRRCTDLVWTVLKKSRASILYEWKTEQCPSLALQHQIIRLVDGRLNRFRIAITQRFSKLPPEKRKLWIAQLSNIEVVPR